MALAPALLLAWLQPAGVVRRAAALLAAFVVGWLAVITLAQSKYAWYDAPIYPALALLIGLGLSILWDDALRLYGPGLGRAGRWALRLGLFATLFYGSYHAVVRQLLAERHPDYSQHPDDYLDHYLPVLARAPQPSQPITLLMSHIDTPLLGYYQLRYQTTAGRTLRAVPGHAARRLAAGQVVVVCTPAHRLALDSTFRVRVLHQEAPCQTLLLLPKPRPAAPPHAAGLGSAAH